MKSTTSFWYGCLIGVLGVIMFSSKAVLVKLVYNHDIKAIDALLLRMLFSFPFYVVIAWLYRKKETDFKVNSKDYLWLVVFGVVGYYLASLFDFIGLTYIKASLERIILFLYPTIVIVLNRIFFKSKITRKQLLAIAITYIGIVIAFGQEVQLSGSGTYLGGFFVLLSAITYASYLVGSGWLIPKFGVIKFTTYAMLVSCICVFIHYVIIGNYQLFNYSKEVYLLGFLVAVIATVIPSFLVSASIKMINSSNFAIMAGIGPISTIILAAIFLGEVLSYWQYLGAMIVIFGVLLVKSKK